jgi:membrane protein implicated in regulation of membrane protease activity
MENLSFDYVLWIIAAPATVVYGAQVLMSLIGFDGEDGLDAELDGDMDVEDGDASGSFPIFTLKNALAFLVGLGWGGLALMDSGYSETMTILLGSLIGLGFAILQTSLFYLMYKFNAPNKPEISSAIGLNAKVYLKVPKNADGYGKIQLTHNDTLKTVNALTYEPNTIGKGRLVTVINVEGDTLVVEPKAKKSK